MKICHSQSKSIDSNANDAGYIIYTNIHLQIFVTESEVAFIFFFRLSYNKDCYDEVTREIPQNVTCAEHPSVQNYSRACLQMCVAYSNEPNFEIMRLILVRNAQKQTINPTP